MINKKRRLIIYFLQVCVLFSAHIMSNAATTAESEVSIEITEGLGPTYPVNPEDPGTDIIESTPVEGSLAILSISDFDFGSIPVTGITKLYDITTDNPNIQVVDLRGSNTGWSVAASVTAFTSDEQPSLLGAVIHIYNGRPNGLMSALYAPAQITDVELTADDTETKVITASDGTGMGLWVMRWYPSKGEELTAYVKLEIPEGAATIGTHMAAINWTLRDAP